MAAVKTDLKRSKSKENFKFVGFKLPFGPSIYLDFIGSLLIFGC